jgi:hypothetical protein
MSHSLLRNVTTVGKPAQIDRQQGVVKRAVRIRHIGENIERHFRKRRACFVRDADAVHALRAGAWLCCPR